MCKKFYVKKIIKKQSRHILCGGFVKFSDFMCLYYHKMLDNSSLVIIAELVYYVYRGMMCMEYEMIPFTFGIAEKKAMNEVLECNEYTQQFGLSLTQEQALALVETRAKTLQDNGRIEFGGGIFPKLIKEFCDSPFLSVEGYSQELHQLVEIFYEYKNETMDLASDDELIQFMKTAFDGVCQGSFALLSGRELNRMAKNLRSGLAANYCEEAAALEEEEINGNYPE